MDTEESVSTASAFGGLGTAPGHLQPPLTSPSNPLRFHVLPPGSIDGCRPNGVITVLSCRVATDALHLSGWISGGKDFGDSVVQLQELESHIKGIHTILDNHMWTIGNVVTFDSNLLEQSNRETDDNDAGVIIAADTLTIFRELHRHHQGNSYATGGSHFKPVHVYFTDRLSGRGPTSEEDPTGESTKLHLLTKDPFGKDFLPSFDDPQFIRPPLRRPVIWENPSTQGNSGDELLTMLPATPDAQEVLSKDEKDRAQEARIKRHKRYEENQKKGTARYNETATDKSGGTAPPPRSVPTTLPLPGPRKFASRKLGRRSRAPKPKDARVSASSSIASSVDSNPPVQAPLPSSFDDLAAAAQPQDPFSATDTTPGASAYGPSELGTSMTPVDWFANPDLHGVQGALSAQQPHGSQQSSLQYPQLSGQGFGSYDQPPQSQLSYPALDPQGECLQSPRPYPLTNEEIQMLSTRPTASGTDTQPRQSHSDKGKGRQDPRDPSYPQ